MMSPIGARVAELEVRVDTYREDVAELKAMIVALDQKVDRRFEAMEEKFERRFDGFERRFEGFERRFEGFERRFDRLTGLLFLILLTIIGGMFGVVTRLL